MSKTRPPIPAPMLREVRQRCGFGCVICGSPLYEYHHIIPYADVKKHEAHNLTLLCHSHHAQVPSLLTNEQVSEANNSPYCIQKGTSSPFGLNFTGPQFVCRIGSNVFSTGVKDENGTTYLIPISIDDTDVLTVSIEPNGHLFLTATFLDEFNLPILLIRENHLLYTTEGWDVEFTGSNLILRQAARKIFLDIDFDPPDTVSITRGRVLCNGVELLIRQRHVFIVNSETLIAENEFEGAAIGVQVGRNDRGLPIAFRSKPTANARYAFTDVGERERRAITKMEKLQTKFEISQGDRPKGEEPSGAD